MTQGLKLDFCEYSEKKLFVEQTGSAVGVILIAVVCRLPIFLLSRFYEAAIAGSDRDHLSINPIQSNPRRRRRRRRRSLRAQAEASMPAS